MGDGSGGGGRLLRLEGQNGISARVDAFRKTFPIAEDQLVPFYLEPVTLDLVADHAELITTIKRHLDTNNARTGRAGHAQSIAARIRKRPEGYVGLCAGRRCYPRHIPIARSPLCIIAGSMETGPRGHTSLTGAVEAQLSVRRSGSETILVEVECAKDGPQGDVVASKLQVVEVGVDQDGETISSCVVAR